MSPLVVSSIIFAIALGLIFTEKFNRTIVAMAGAAVMLIVGRMMGFYSEELAFETIDFNTLGLLFGMMVLVAILEPTGFFEFLAIWVGKLSKGRPVRLLVLLGTATTLVSMFLDNVTTVVLIAPVTILICEVLGITPRPFLIALALLSNTGGVATMVGDPPNILIASATGFTFMDFIIRAMPVAVVSWFAALLLLNRLFKTEFATYQANSADALDKLDPKAALKDRNTAVKTIMIILLAVAGFLLERVLHATPAFIAMSCASFGLALSNPDIRNTLNHVEWDILLFFGSLFVLVGGLEASGVLEQLAELIAHSAVLPGVVQGILLLWVVAILSAVVDNIPITIALIPVIQGLSASGLDVAPLWWAWCLVLDLVEMERSLVQLPMWWSPLFLKKPVIRSPLRFGAKVVYRSCLSHARLPQLCMLVFISQWVGAKHLLLDSESWSNLTGSFLLKKGISGEIIQFGIYKI